MRERFSFAGQLPEKAKAKMRPATPQGYSGHVCYIRESIVFWCPPKVRLFCGVRAVKFRVLFTFPPKAGKFRGNFAIAIEIMEINQSEDSKSVLEQNAGDIQPNIEEQPVKLEFKVDMDEAMEQLDVPCKKVKKMENAYLLALNTKEQIEVSKITMF